MKRTKLCVVLPTYNEEECLPILLELLLGPVANGLLERFNVETSVLIIDNFSTDKTRTLIEDYAARNTNVMAILNRRNFGQLRSPVHGVLRAPGDVIVLMASDLQDPPDLIAEMFELYRNGSKIVAATRRSTDERGIMPNLRSLFYIMLSRFNDGPVIPNLASFVLLDRCVVEDMRALSDPVPFFRTLYLEFGYPFSVIPFHQPDRPAGRSKNNLITLFDYAIVGLTSNSKSVMRLVTVFGGLLGVLSILVGTYYLIQKIFFWDTYTLGLAPLIIGVFFLLSFLLFFLGLLGEFQLRILEYARNRPLVYEEKSINLPAGNSRTKN